MKKLFYYLLLCGVLFVHSNVVAQTAKIQNLGTIENVNAQFSTKKISQEFLLKVSSDKSLSIKITAIKTENGQFKIYGAIQGAKSSLFYLNLDAKNISGKILDNDKGISYQITTNDSKEVIVEEVGKKEIVCEIQTQLKNKASKQKKTTGKAAAVPVLSSYPGAPIVVYLDFDGENVDDPNWNSQIDGAPGYANAPNFDSAFITQVWATVSEDYRPFNINVTTDRAVFDAGTRGKRIQCIIVPNFHIGNSGGISEFNIISPNPSTEKCFVFNDHLEQTVTDIAQTASHEVGHGFDLRHDGSTTDGNYWKGHGNYGAIMGSNYQATRGIYHWSKGEYKNATTHGGGPNVQDDIASIATRTGSSFRADDHGGNTSSATALKAETNGNLLATKNNGIIEQRTDKDYFSFTHGGGNVVLNIQSGTNRTAREANLDIQARLLNSGGTQVAISNPDGLNAAINTNQPAGTYYLEIDGVGSGDPLTNGYSDYGSLGYYQISGSYVVGSNPAVCNAPSGLAVENLGSTTATLNWADGNSVSGYTVQVKPTTSSTWQSYSASSSVYNLTGLNSGTTYQWQVKSTCSSSSSSNYTSGSNFTPTNTTPSCSAPASASAANITSTSATLNWSSTGAPNYFIYVLPEGGDWYNPASDITGTSYNLSGLVANKTYTIDIYSNCPGDALAKRFTFTTKSSGNTCGAPSSASASNINTTTATLNWASTGAPNYFIYVLPEGGDWYNPASNLTGTSYNLSGLAANKSYTIDIYSNCPGGAVAKRFTFTTKSSSNTCGAPSSASASNISSTTATLKWSATSAPNYYIYIQPNGGNWYLQTYDFTGTSYNLTGLAPGQTYTVDVYSNCSAGAVAKRFTFTTSTSNGLGGPSNMRIVSQSKGQVQLAWNAVSGAQNYKVQIKSANSSDWSTFSTKSNGITFNGLQNGQVYNWRVASNSNNVSSAYVQGLDIYGSGSGGAGNGKELSVVEENEDVKVFPNPSTNNFTLQLGNSASQFADVIITTISGKVVYTASNLDASLPFTFGDQLPAGIYIIKLITAEKTSIKKVVKQ